MTAAKATPAHTPGPWVRRSIPGHLFEIVGADGNAVLKIRGGMMPMLEDAARIVACVNAFEGISTDMVLCHDLQKAGAKKAELTAERDALRAEVERLREALRGSIRALSTLAAMDDDLARSKLAGAAADAAIAALGGRA